MHAALPRGQRREQVHVELGALRRIVVHVRLRGHGVARLDLVPVLVAQLPEQDDPVGGGALRDQVRAQRLDRRRRQGRVLIQHAAEQHAVPDGEGQRLAVGERRHVHQLVLGGVLQQVVGGHADRVALGAVDLAHELKQVQPQGPLAAEDVLRLDGQAPALEHSSTAAAAAPASRDLRHAHSANSPFIASSSGSAPM